MNDRKQALRRLAVLALLAAAASAGAAPYIESRYGAQNAFLLPEISAMAGSGVALYRGGMSGLLNPAMLTDARALRLDVGAALEHADEDRFQPLFDSFPSYVTDVAIASNRNDFFASGIALAGPVGGTASPVAFSASLADRYAFGYRFEEEIRNPGYSGVDQDDILEQRSYEVSGTLRDLTLGLATEVIPGYSLGLAVNYAFGSRDEVASRRGLAGTFADSTSREVVTWDPSGVNVTAGLRIRLSSRLELGAAYESPLTVDGDARWTIDDPDSGLTESDGSHEIRYPGEYRLGLAMRPRNDPRTVVTAEVAYREWSELENDLLAADAPDNDLEDVLDVRFGAQHTFASDMRMLFGFRHYDSYHDEDAGTSVFSAGVGAPLSAGEFVVSAELSKVASIQPHIFPYPSGAGSYGTIVTEPTARVEDTRLRVAVGFTRHF